MKELNLKALILLRQIFPYIFVISGPKPPIKKKKERKRSPCSPRNLTGYKYYLGNDNHLNPNYLSTRPINLPQNPA